MTLASMPGPSGAARSQRILTLTAFGTAREVAALLEAKGPLLASGLSLTRQQPLPPDAVPQRALQAPRVSLTPGCRGLLLTVPVDPGVPLPNGGCWGEALGAWRLPTLVLLRAEQLHTGWPAAATALLNHHRVPLVGLLQCGGDWVGERRRQDGLPWLGHLDGDSESTERMLFLVLDRWQRILRSLC